MSMGEDSHRPLNGRLPISGISRSWQGVWQSFLNPCLRGDVSLLGSGRAAAK